MSLFDEEKAITVEDILEKIYARRGVWYNSEKDFREEIFERNCIYLEDMGIDPIKDPKTLNICIKSDYTNLLNYMNRVYWESTQLVYITWRNNVEKEDG